MSEQALHFRNGLHAAKVRDLARRLFDAETSLDALTGGGVDAILDSTGNAYLLRAAQERFRQNKSSAQALLDNFPDAITVVNRRGVIVSQSRAMTRVLGYEPGDWVGRSIFELVHQADLDRPYTAFFNVIEGFQEHATVQFRLPARDGSYRMMEATVGLLCDVSPACAVFSLRPPATGPLRAHPEPARREAVFAGDSAAKDRFLTMVSHELRARLTPAFLGVQELQEDERFAEARPTLTMIRRNMELQSRLLEEFLDFTTVGQHKMRLQLESIDAME
jgi:PAS domain S-box-containing protein